MACRGRIKNGTVQADEPFPWPDGTEVVVVPTSHKSLDSMLGLLATGQTPPSDSECDRIRQSELLRDHDA